MNETREYVAKIYKHIDAKYADGFESGTSIAIGTLSSYRALEGERGDRLEGVAEYVTGEQFLSPQQLSHPQFAEARRLTGLPPDGFDPTRFNNVLIGGNTVRYIEPTTYIFCASLEPDLSRVDMGEAIFEISSIDLFAHRLSKARSSLLARAQWGKVVYETRSANPFRGGHVNRGPFFKSKDMEWENEFRLVWRVLANQSGLDREIVSAPRTASLIKRIA